MNIMIVSNELKAKYVGKVVRLYPNDSYKKIAIIEDVDEFGWTFKFIEGTCPSSGYAIGEVAFYNHAQNVIFKFI